MSSPKQSSRIIALDDLLAGIRERKAALGIEASPDWNKSICNSGERRTSRKRAMLARIDERVRAAKGED